jgi:hypothetical protein
MNFNITIGNYKNTAYSFFNGTRVITLNGLDFPIDISKIKLVANQTQNKLYGAKSFWSGCTTQYNAPTTTCTVGTATSGGAVTAGTHQYKITFVYSTGDESLASSASTQITVVGGTQTVPLTAIPLGGANVVARNIYRTAAGGSTYLYLAQIADNTTTTYSDTISDGSLAVNEPTITTAYDIVISASFPVLATNDVLLIEVEIADPVDDVDLGITKVMDLTNAELPPADTEVASVSDTNLAINTYFYELSQNSWRNFIAQIKATCSTTSSVLKVYVTLDPSAAIPATGGTPSVDWIDATTIIFGSSTVSVPTTGTYQDLRNWAIDTNKMQIMYDRFLVSYQTLNATNFIQINIRKF